MNAFLINKKFLLLKKYEWKKTVSLLYDMGTLIKYTLIYFFCKLI